MERCNQKFELIIDSDKRIDKLELWGLIMDNYPEAMVTVAEEE